MFFNLLVTRCIFNFSFCLFNFGELWPFTVTIWFRLVLCWKCCRNLTRPYIVWLPLQLLFGCLLYIIRCVSESGFRQHYSELNMFIQLLWLKRVQKLLILNITNRRFGTELTLFRISSYNHAPLPVLFDLPHWVSSANFLPLWLPQALLAFSHTAPRLCNPLPENVRDIDSLHQCKSRLKNHHSKLLILYDFWL